MISDVNIRVDRDKCFACGLCVERCIMDNLRLSVAPCRQACPLGMNCQGYVRLIAQGKTAAAAEEIRAFFPFVHILARVCHHPCEAACERGRIDGPVHIRALKRHLADACADLLDAPPAAGRASGRRVAVIGSGPAGLMAACDLTMAGHAVTVFEADPEPGGLLRYAIPSFRLPVAHVDHAVGLLARMGIGFETSRRIDLADFDQLAARYDALVLAAGAGPASRLEAPGGGLPAVVPALDFMRQVKAGRRPAAGGRVLVLGGGNTAVDAALTCRRLGAAEVRLVSLEQRHELPASAAALAEAREEGVRFETGWGAAELRPGECAGAEVGLARCLALTDEAGRFSPELEPVCARTLSADLVLNATGQQGTAGRLPGELLDERTGRPLADALTLQALARPKVFFCGDIVGGPSSVVHALASGRQAALSAARFLAGEGLRWGRDPGKAAWVREYESLPARAAGGPRGKLPRIAVEARGIETEVERTFSPREALAEAERCLSCGRSFEMNQTCWYCLPCEIECPARALEVRMPYLVR
jgi:NADPH-dependent glutamate synthase beta subunit-like oxidoreductase